MVVPVEHANWESTAATRAEQKMRRAINRIRNSSNDSRMSCVFSRGERNGREALAKPLLRGFLGHPVWMMAIVWLLWESPAAGTAHAGEIARPAIQMGSAAGCRRYRPGFWGVVGVNVSNPTENDVELHAVSFIAGDPTLQYGRRIWVPPKSILKSTCPIRVPDSLPAGTERIDLVAVPIDPVSGADVPLSSHMEAMGESRPLIVVEDPVTVGIVGDFGSTDAAGQDLPFYRGVESPQTAPDDLIFSLVQAGQKAEELFPRVSAFGAREIPADAASLDALNVLVVCTDQVASDPDAAGLIRNWVLAGGHLWVMLDELEEASVAAILGDAFTSTIVDRVDLTEVTFENVRDDVHSKEGGPLEFDQPIPLVRVLARGVTVTDRVDGWPVAFWQPFGEGKVFYTALGAAAWFQSATMARSDAEPATSEAPSGAGDSLRRFVSDCFSRQTGEFRHGVDVAPILARQIGYRILNREIVAALLAAFCVVLGAAGGWCWKIGHLDRLLWIGPLAAIATSLVFLRVATTSRNSVPPTVAVWQSIDLEPGVATGRTRGLVSLYSPEISECKMGAVRGGVFIPDMAGMGGERRRMMWTDEGTWHWEALELPPGIRTAPLEHTLHLDRPIGCRARFGPSGLTGSFGPAPFTGLADAVIAVPNQPLMAAKMGPGGSFTSGADDVLTPGDFLADTWLSDVQQRHADIYELVFERASDVDGRTRPTFHVWADPIDMGFAFSQSNQIGSALISIPLQIERSEQGSEVSVPAPFIACRGVTGPAGERSGTYSSYRGEWGESKNATSQWLRFQVPDSVLPLELSRAVISLSIRAPSRSVEILGLSDGQPVVLRELTHPIGAYEVILDQPNLLQLDDQGGLSVAVRVGKEQSADVDNLMAQAPWKVEFMHLAVAGRVLGE